MWRVPVLAVDRSPAMLRVAASNCRGSGVTLLRQDIRRLVLPRAVDLVTANFDTVNHLLEDGELPALSSACTAIFVPVDTSSSISLPRAIRRRGRCTSARQATATSASPNASAGNLAGVSSCTSIVFRQRARAPRVELHRERAYAPHEVAAWLADAGFGAARSAGREHPRARRALSDARDCHRRKEGLTDGARAQSAVSPARSEARTLSPDRYWAGRGVGSRTSVTVSRFRGKRQKSAPIPLANRFRRRGSSRADHCGNRDLILHERQSAAKLDEPDRPIPFQSEDAGGRH